MPIKKSSARKGKPREHIALPGGCYMSKPFIHPVNWKMPSASCKKDWYIHYRFYDPFNKPTGKQRILRGMNDFKTAMGRRQATEHLLAEEMDLLERGFNPVTLKGASPILAWEAVLLPGEDLPDELTEHTLLPEALQMAFKRCSCDPNTKKDIRGMLHRVPMAINLLKYHTMPVGKISRKHVVRILDKCSEIKSRWDADLNREIKLTWSEDKFNKFRAYLMILFKEMIRVEAIEANPCNDIEIKKTVKRIRQTMTKIERNRVDAYLRWFHPDFHRFLHIFFHSGARESEIMGVKGKHVDFRNQTFIRTIKKGSTYREKATTIKDIALPLWQEAMERCRPEDFVFGRRFVPGPRFLLPSRICRVWKKEVKDVLGITADFYSLKHSNSTETARLKGDQVAANQNGHTSTAMVIKIYDVERGTREHEEMKQVNNPFV